MSNCPPDPPLPQNVGAAVVEVVSAAQHIRKMRGGSTAHLMHASDGYSYVTKYQNNSQHNRLLANELLAGLIALHLGLPIPAMRIIDVSPWLIENTPQLRIEKEGRDWACSSGLQFGSRFMAEEPDIILADWMDEPEKARVRIPQDFARALVFDKWTGNSDGRQAIFTRKTRQRKWNAIFIDNGHCFDGNRWQFEDQTLHGVYYRNWFYESVTGWHSFEPALSSAMHFALDDLWRYANALPGEWYQQDRHGLRRLIETLDQRRRLIPDLITVFRNSSRQPFPNWTERG